MIICGLPTPWYVSGPCCDDPLHLDNITDRELKGGARRGEAQQQGLPAFPGCTIFDPVLTFIDVEDEDDLAGLNSSGGVGIWREDEPVHLTDTAYGNIAKHLVDVVTGSTNSEAAVLPRKRLERYVTRYGADPAQKPLPGWIIGGNQGGARGSDQGRGLTGGLGGDRVKVGRGKGKG